MVLPGEIETAMVWSSRVLLYSVYILLLSQFISFVFRSNVFYYRIAFVGDMNINTFGGASVQCTAIRFSLSFRDGEEGRRWRLPEDGR